MFFGKCLKKFLCAATAAALIFSMPCLPVQAADSAADKLARIEQDTYGSEQPGAVLNRLSRLEKNYVGKNFQGDMNARIDAIYEIIYGNSSEPSVLAKINAIEWNMNHEVSSDDVVNRVARLESAILGTVGDGQSFNSRLKALTKASFGKDTIPVVEVKNMPSDTMIKVELVETIGSRNLAVGDTVEMEVVDDVIVDGVLVFAKGLRGSGVVQKVRKAKGWGRNGKVDIDFDELTCIDGSAIPVYIGIDSKNTMTEQKMINGARLVGMDLSSDWDKAMVHGKNVEIPAGTEFYVQTKDFTNIHGIQVGTGGLPLVADTNDDDDEGMIVEIPSRNG